MPTQSASLYEQLFPLTTVMKQRVVDNFSGDSLDDRWTEYINSTGTLSMADAVDGGFILDPVGSNGDTVKISFNGISQYAHDGSVFIAVAKVTNTSGASLQTGLEAGTNSSQPYYSGNDTATFMADPSQSSNFLLVTDSGTGQTKSDTGNAIDTDWHSIKISSTGSATELFIDGVSEVTSSTNLANTNMMPIVYSRTDSGLVHAPVHIRYLEAYNT